MNIISILPHVQAGLNITALGFMILGYYYIHIKKNQAAHRTCMILAVLVSTLFLISYLYYHSQVGNLKFAGEGLIRPIYFSILISHVLLAALIVPLILITFSYALKGNFVVHPRYARWTLPLWIYVSVTGVIVYLLAFHIYSP